MVKLFQKPIDDAVIRNINPAQMLWYAAMFNQDREEQFDNDLNLTEYLASFINYEAVRQTKDARENTKVVTDEDFGQILRDQFGRDLAPDTESVGRPMSLDEPLKDKATEQQKTRKKKRGHISIADIKKYTGMNIDEIRFIPDKEKK